MVDEPKGVGYGEYSKTTALDTPAKQARDSRWRAGLSGQTAADVDYYNKQGSDTEKTAGYQQNLAQEAVDRGDTQAAVGHAKAAKAIRDRGGSTSSLKSYDKGGIVDKTGPAIVHKGERIIPVKESPLSKKESKSKSKKHHKLQMHIHSADGGGFRADSSHIAHPEDDSPVPAPEEHNLPDADSLATHVQESFSPQADPETPPDGAAPPQGESPQPTPTQGQI